MNLPTTRRPSERLLARLVLRLYPPAWRERYGAEVSAHLDDSDGRAAAALSLAWRALPVWLWPPGHLRDRDGQLRSSLGMILTAGGMLAGVGLVFAQLTQFQGFGAGRGGVVPASYLVFDAAMAVAALAGAAGALPLWLVMLRRARREHRPRQTAYLLAPLVVPPAYLALLVAATRLFGGPHGISPGLFLTVTLAGFGAAAVTCAGPVLALGRLKPRGPAVRWAVRAGSVATAAIVVAGGASIVAVAGLCRWAPAFAGYHSGIVLCGYLAVVGGLAAAAGTGALRGLRAAR
ncbi:MAG TPA: hypothetical protein VGD91_07070 [Trebonia sp.]